MHGASVDQFVDKAASFLGMYYFVLAIMNAAVAGLMQFRLKQGRAALVCLCAAMVFVILAAFSSSGTLFGLGHGIEAFVNSLLSGNRGAVFYTLGTTVMLVVLYVFRRFFVQPAVAYTGFNLVMLLLGIANCADVATLLASSTALAAGWAASVRRDTALRCGAFAALAQGRVARVRFCHRW